MKHKFIGKPDSKFPDLVAGAVYNLKIHVDNWMQPSGKQRPCIVNPFRCPYKSWFTFYQNWEPDYDFNKYEEALNRANYAQAPCTHEWIAKVQKEGVFEYCKWCHEIKLIKWKELK